MTPFHPTLPFTPPTREVGFRRFRRRRGPALGDKERSLPARYGSDVDLRTRAPPTETHFCVGAFEQAAQFQLTRGGGLDINTVAPSQSLIASRAAYSTSGATACGESLSPPTGCNQLVLAEPLHLLPPLV
jgi:hypothetical protein